MYSYLLSIFSLLTSSLAHPSPQYHGNHTRVAYFQDNDPAGNSIVALKIDPIDGTLSSPISTSTGGKGLAGLLAVSQDSVTVSQDV